MSTGYVTVYRDEYEYMCERISEQQERMEQLEDLCRDFLDAWRNEQEHSFARPLLAMRMQYLGLLEGEQ